MVAKAEPKVDLEGFLASAASKMAEEKLGFKIPASINAAKDAFIGGGAARTAEVFAPRVAKLAENIASNMGNPDNAANIGRITENIWRTGVPLLPVVYKTVSRYRKSVGDYFSLGDKFSTALSSQNKSGSFFNIVNSDLEVVKNERQRISKHIHNDSKITLAEALSTIPAQIGTQLDKIIQDVKFRNLNESKADVNTKSTVSDKAEALRLKSAKAVDTGIDKTLEFLSSDDPKKLGARKFNSAASFVTEYFLESSLESLQAPENRAVFLQSVKNKAFGFLTYSGAAGLSSYIGSKLDVKSEKQLKQNNAALMVSSLSDNLKKSGALDVTKLVGKSANTYTLTQYIVDIFQQHQKDCGRDEIPQRLMARLTQSANQIVDAMLDPQRQLDAQALIILVDKQKGIAQFSDGKMTEISFGEELNDTLASLQQKPSMSRRSKLTAEKQYKTMQATPEQLKQSWANLTPEEKKLWSTFLSDEILTDLGVTKTELPQLRNHDNELWRETMQELLSAFAQITPAEMHEIGITDVQKEQISEAIVNLTQSTKNDYLAQHRGELTELLADTATLTQNRNSNFIKDIIHKAEARQNHAEILKHKKDNQSIAEQIATKRNHLPETYRS